MFEFVICSVLFVLMIIMGEEMMLFAGAISGLGFLDFWLMFFVCLAGTYIGDIVFFKIGWHYGDKVIDKFGKYILMPRKRFEKIRRIFDNNGFWILIVSKFAYGLGHLTLLAAGASKLNPKRVFRNQAFSSLGFVVVFGGLGYFFSSSILSLTADFKILGLIIIVLIFSLFIVSKIIDIIIDKVYP